MHMAVGIPRSKLAANSNQGVCDMQDGFTAMDRIMSLDWTRQAADVIKLAVDCLTQQEKLADAENILTRASSRGGKWQTWAKSQGA